MAGYTDANGNEYDDQGNVVKTSEGTTKQTANPGVNTKSADAETGYQQGKALKAAALEASKKQADIYGQIAAAKTGQAGAVGSAYDAATKAGITDMRAAGAQALAAAQAGGGEGAANYGAMLQNAATTGRGLSSFEASQTAAKTGAMQAAQNAALEAQAQAGGAQAAYAKEALAAGSDEAERNALRAQAADQEATIIKNNKGAFNDDEQTMYQQLVAYAQTVGDPVVKQEIIDRAKRILSGAEDV